jgi:spore coat polysaccharide biosynthesis predicted glycosyltransferase SpsG
MGHMYRVMTIARMFPEHMVRFLYHDIDQPIYIMDAIFSLYPDLVINDILDTRARDVQRLRNHGIRVVNFEDFGTGAPHADLTINELFDKPEKSPANTLWGHEYFILRDEFTDVFPRCFVPKVNLLITFGGNDENNLTLAAFEAVYPFCEEQGIHVSVVTGPGYPHVTSLMKRLPRDVAYTHATGVMSRIMEHMDLAISGNGRTVYELAHMHIPGIILSQNERETTHLFANIDNGFVPTKQENLLSTLKSIVQNTDYRKLLYDNTTRFNFIDNKKRVRDLIAGLL